MIRSAHFKKTLALVLALCLCLGLMGTALAGEGEGLVLLNAKENKSEVYGMNTYYTESLTAAQLEGLTEGCIVVYLKDAGGVTKDLTASVHGEYKTQVNGNTVYLVPMDEVIVLEKGDYQENYAGDGKNVLIVLKDGANLTGTLTDVSLSMQAGATWTLTGDSVLVGLDACRAILRGNVFGNGHVGWYNSEVYLSDDMREWTEQLADTTGAWTSWSDPAELTFDDYRDAILAGQKDDVISQDNVFISIFPVNIAELITASVYDDAADAADVSQQSGTYIFADEYAELRDGHGYQGGDIEYDTVITTDPASNDQVNRSSIYATDTTLQFSDIFINQLSYATSIVYADGTNRAQDAMMKYGVNSAVWAQGEDAVIDLENFYCLGANDGFYATYGGTIIAQNGVLDVTANHGLQVCYDGTIIARNMDIITTGMMGSAISSDHGGGFLFCDNVFALAAYGSTGGGGIYCDGYCDFWIQNSTVGSLNDHAAVMCGGGTLNLVSTTLFSQYDSQNQTSSDTGKDDGVPVDDKDDGVPSGDKGEGVLSGDKGEGIPADGGSASATVTKGAGVYIHPMGNNPGRVTTLNVTDVTLKVPGYAFWTFGKSADITVSGVLDVTGVESGVLLYAKQMDGGNSFIGGKTLDQAYDLPENVTTLTFDGGTLVGQGDICYAAQDDESGNYAEIHVTLKNGSSYTGAVQADSMTIDATSAWHVTGESVIAALSCEGAIYGTVSQQADGSWLITASDEIYTGSAPQTEAEAQPDGDGTENEGNTLGGAVYAADQASLDAYLDYLCAYADAGVNDPTFADGSGGFDQGAADNAKAELSGITLSTNLSEFPVEMFANGFGAMDYSSWAKAQ